jgi:hypothetical protein
MLFCAQRRYLFSEGDYFKMTSYEKLKFLDSISENLKKNETFFNIILKLSDVYDNAYMPLTIMLNGTGDDRRTLGLYNSAISALRESITIWKQISSREFFREIEDMEKTLLQLKTNYPSFSGKILAEDIYNHVSNYSTAYEKCLHDQALFNLRTLIYEAKEIKSLFEKINSFYLLINQSDQKQIEADQETLSLVFKSSTSFPDFIIKLDSFRKLYSTLCELFEINENNEPINIIKIESGSLWLKVAGNNKVMEMSTDLIKSGIRFFHRNFTTEGKIQTIPKKVEAVESILGLAKKLEAEGIDTSKIKDNLNKAVVSVSNELNDLLRYEPSIIINDAEYSVGAELEQKYLEEAKKLLIEDKRDE